MSRVVVSSCLWAMQSWRVFVTVVVALIGLATLAGLLDRVWWVFEPADVFRVQYLVVLVAAALVALPLGRPRLAALAAVLAAVNLAVLRIAFPSDITAAPTARSRLGKRVVVCGDFNSPPWSAPLRRFAANARLRDVYGSRAWAAYSWPTWASALRVPLDNCFVGDDVVVTGHHDGPNVGSDHRPLVVDIGVG